MKNCLLFLLVLASSLTFASSCPDPRLREAFIGGNSIDGAVLLKHKPLKFAHVELYSADKMIWSGTTDKNGKFEIGNLVSGKYLLSVSHWGSANVELKHELDALGNGQRPRYILMLSDNGCVGVTQIVD